MLTIGCGAGIVRVNAINGKKLGRNNCLPLQPGERVAVRGSFKTSGLRNVAFTGPYFHNGSRKNVAEVINGFYQLGGHFPITNIDDFDAEIKPLGLTNAERLEHSGLAREGR